MIRTSLDAQAQATLVVISKKTEPHDMRALVKTVAEVIVARTRRAILKQEYTWVPLRRSTVQRKDVYGESRLLVMTQDYVRSLGVREVPGGVEAVGDGRLGRRLEYGTAHMPARPHWRPMLARAATDPEILEEVTRALSRD